MSAQNDKMQFFGAGFRTNAMQDLIFVSLENWDEIWRRNQFLCAELACRFPERKILFVCPSRDLPNRLRRGKEYPMPEEITVTVPGLPNITVTYPLKALPKTYRWGRRFNDLLLKSHIRRVARRLRMQRPILWINPAFAGSLAGCLGESILVYDITDDWELASLPIREKRFIEGQDRQLCRMSDLVIVCSEALERSRQAFCKRILLLPNGVDADHYRPIAEVATPTALSDYPSPVFGYTGTLHPDRIDKRVIIALARAFPQGSVVLIGPNCLDEQTYRQLAEERNIQLLGPVPYRQIPDYMAAFDVCIVPHIESAFTESLNPIKLWEYLACGKPIASTNVAGFRDYTHLCHIGSGIDGFVNVCKAALAEDDSRREERMAEAVRNSWVSRVDCLLATLHSIGAAS